MEDAEDGRPLAPQTILFWLIGGAAATLAMGLVDYLTGPEVSLSILYVIPIVAVAWKTNRRAGVVMAVFGAAVWLAADLAGRDDPFRHLISYWNAAVRLAFFLIVGLSFSNIREKNRRLLLAYSKLYNFAADLAHEFRNPLHALMGRAEVTLARPRSVEEYQEVLRSGLEEMERLGRMVETLLFLARSESSLATIEAKRLDGRKEMETVAEFYRVLAEEKQVKIDTDGQGAVWADPTLFHRALGNLLDNALQHTPVGGQIRVAIRETIDRGAEVTVRDNGCGIAPEHLDRIWDRFQRAGKRASGTGLGLAIVKSIMDLHGGTASLRSQPGRGTAATLRFPPRKIA